MSGSEELGTDILDRTLPPEDRLGEAFGEHPDWCKCQRVCGGDQ